MQVPHEIAIPYAHDVLRTGRTLSEVVRSRLDLSKGRFETTAEFRVDEADRWQLAGVGGDANLMADEDGTEEVDFTYGVAKKLLPGLRSDRRLLLAENAIPFPKPTVRPHSPFHPIRRYQLEAAAGYDEYVALQGGEVDTQLVRKAIRLADALWREFGVVVEHDPKELPPDGSWLDRDKLEQMLGDVVAVFLRQSPFDGFLLWSPD